MSKKRVYCPECGDYDFTNYVGTSTTISESDSVKSTIKVVAHNCECGCSFTIVGEQSLVEK